MNRSSILTVIVLGVTVLGQQAGTGMAQLSLAQQSRNAALAQVKK